MATLRIIVLKHQQKSNGSYNIKIRVTHNRESAYLATNHYVNQSQLSKDFKLLEQDPISIADTVVVDIDKYGIPNIKLLE